MTIKEARAIVRNFDEGKIVSEDDSFMFVEAMNFLIEELHDPKDMMYLGGYYYDLKHFDLALKYYEMAATYDYDVAYDCLGYIWYYGRTGVKDYEKAFKYFSKLMDKGDLVASYKVADMYKNGYFVEKDIAKYESIIEELFDKAQDLRNVFDPVPEIFTRLARIRKKQGRIDEAINLNIYSKRFLAQRIKYNAFFGNLNIMKWLIEDLYSLIEFDYDEFDFFDLYFLLLEPAEVNFRYGDQVHTIKSETEDNEHHVCFDGKWYRTIDDFISSAAIGSDKLTSIADEFYDFEVVT